MDNAPLPEKLSPYIDLETLIDIKEYKLSIDTQEYKAQIGKLENSSKIIFKLQETSELKDYYYKSDYSLNDLKQFSKIFRIFDTMDEAFKVIDEMFKNQNVYLEKDTNNLILHLTISNVLSLKEDISLNIKKETMNKEQSYTLLFQSINQMKETIQKDRQDFENRITIKH